MLHWILSGIVWAFDTLFTILFLLILLKVLLFFVPSHRMRLFRKWAGWSDWFVNLVKKFVDRFIGQFDSSLLCPIIALALCFLCVRYLSPLLFWLSSYTLLWQR